MKKLTGSFRYTQWDPWLLIAQIISVQCIMYVSLGVILLILGFLAGNSRTRFRGKMVISAFVLNALVGSAVLWIVVERTKQCLDFSCTWHFIHLIICWFYNGNFPTTFSWWALNVACVTLMCVCGEFLCLKSELKAIPLSLGPKTDL